MTRTNPKAVARTCGRLAVALALLAASGCLEIETRIKLNEDGSAVVTERLRLLRPLLDMEAAAPGGTGTTFAKLLSRERAEERLKEMGKGVTLASHTVRDADGGSREAVTVYRVADVNQLVYVTPFLGRGERLGKVHVRLSAQYGPYGKPGTLEIKLEPKNVPWKPGEGALARELARSVESPLARQQYRDVAPAFRDMLQGLKIRLTLESYGPFVPPRGVPRATTTDVINYSYSAESGGRTGTHPLDDEEVMADLLKLLFASSGDPWCERRGPFLGRHTVGSRFQAVIRPSRALFKEYFEGKTLAFPRPGAPAVTRKAEFAEIGEPPKPEKPPEDKPGAKPPK